LTVTLRYEQAILLPEDESTALNLVVVTFCAVTLFSVLFGVLAWRAHQATWLPRTVAPLGALWWIVTLAVFGAGVYQTLNFWALRQRAYRRVAGTKFTQVFLQLAAQLGLGLAHAGPLGLLFGDALGRVGGSVSLSQRLWSRSRTAMRAIRWSTLRNAAVRYRRFPLISCGSALINTAGIAIPAILIAQFYGARTLGWYALGDRVLGAPVILIGQAVSQVYAVEAAALINSNPKALHSLFRRSIKQLALLGLLPLFPFLFLSPSVFGFVFGAGWKEAGVYASLLSCSYYVAFIVWPLIPTLYLLEEQSWQLYWDIGRMILTLGSLLLAYRLGWGARAAVGLLSASMIVGYLLHLFLANLAIQRRMETFSAAQDRTNATSPQVVSLGQVG
jgi:O-antigen/teichoic acid export membrane protein